MGELETLMKIMEKLQEVDKLKERVKELENTVEKLSNAVVEQRTRELTISDGNEDERLARAAELAIVHWKKNPPRGASP